MMNLRRNPLPGASQGNLFINREKLPVWDASKCTCGEYCILVDYCPEGVIDYRNDGLNREFKIDYEYCKGCGICAKECTANPQAVEDKDAVEVYGR